MVSSKSYLLNICSSFISISSILLMVLWCSLSCLADMYKLSKVARSFLNILYFFNKKKLFQTCNFCDIFSSKLFCAFDQIKFIFSIRNFGSLLATIPIIKNREINTIFIFNNKMSKKIELEARMVQVKTGNVNVPG